MGKTASIEKKGNSAFGSAIPRVLTAAALTVALAFSPGKVLASTTPLVDNSPKSGKVSSIFSNADNEKTRSVDSMFIEAGMQSSSQKARDNILWLSSHSVDQAGVTDAMNSYFDSRGLNPRSVKLFGNIIGEIKSSGDTAVTPATLVRFMVYRGGDSTKMRAVPHSVWLVMNGLEGTYSKYCGSSTTSQPAGQPVTWTANTPATEQYVWTKVMPAAPTPAVPAVSPEKKVEPPVQPKPAPVAVGPQAPVIKTAIIKPKPHKNHIKHLKLVKKHKRHGPSIAKASAAQHPAKNIISDMKKAIKNYMKSLGKIATKERVNKYGGMTAGAAVLGIGALWLLAKINSRERRALKRARKVLFKYSTSRKRPKLGFESITGRALELARKRSNKVRATVMLRSVKSQLRNGFDISDPRMLDFSSEINALKTAKRAKR